MDPNILNQWLSFAANFGVVVGLILVALQIKQNTQITKAQITNDYYIADMELELAMMGENPAVPWAKSIYEPNEITIEDAVILDRYFNYGIVQIKRLRRMQEMGLADDDWKKRLSYLGWHLGNEVGRRWWEYSKVGMPDEFVKTVDGILADREYHANKDLLDSLLPDETGG